MGTNRKILIIDDEKDVAHLAAKRLRAGGYDVACVFEGDNAVDQVRQIVPDLVLMDIWLPGISGIDLYREIRSFRETEKIPVIFFSADPSKESFCLEDLRAEGFIKKPYSPSDLLGQVQRVLLDKKAPSPANEGGGI